ncbi:phage holin family protein [Ferruginibacter sp.]|nr:hypothetical protein [Ferruginibacter sp.]
MEKAFAKAEELAGTIKEYINTRIEAVKLSAAEKSSAIIANLIAGAVVALVFIFFIMLASISAALLLGLWIGATWAGFLMVAGLYLLAAIIVWKARGKLIRLPIMNALIKQLFKTDEDEDN